MDHASKSSGAEGQYQVAQHEIDLIAEGIARRLEQRQKERSAESIMGGEDRSRDSAYATAARAADRDENTGPLGEIAARIRDRTRSMSEIAAKLNAHADRVHGHVPEPGARGGPVDGHAKGMPAVQAIMIALDDLDNVLADVSQAAGRNCTLA